VGSTALSACLVVGDQMMGSPSRGKGSVPVLAIVMPAVLVESSVGPAMPLRICGIRVSEIGFAWC